MTNPLNLHLDQESIKALQDKSAEIQNKMMMAQKKLSAIEITGEAGGGVVKVVMNGRYEAHGDKMFIEPELLKQPTRVLCDLIAAAVTDATRKVEAIVQNEMFSLIQGLGLPDFGGAGGGAGGTTGTGA